MAPQQHVMTVKAAHGWCWRWGVKCLTFTYYSRPHKEMGWPAALSSQTISRTFWKLSATLLYETGSEKIILLWWSILPKPLFIGTGYDDDDDDQVKFFLFLDSMGSWPSGGRQKCFATVLARLPGGIKIKTRKGPFACLRDFGHTLWVHTFVDLWNLWWGYNYH